MANTHFPLSVFFITLTAPLAVLATGCEGSPREAAGETTPSAISRYFEATNTAGANAERSARDLLAGMRVEPDATVLALRTAYAETPEASYQQRWRLVSLAAALAVPSARPVLVEVAASPIPPERVSRSPGQHWEGGSRDEEIMIRMQALAGLGTLARAGDGLSRDALAQIVPSPDRVVRAAAVLQLLKAGAYAPEHVRSVGALLTAEDQWMLSQREVALDELTPAAAPGPSKKTKTFPALRPSAP